MTIYGLLCVVLAQWARNVAGQPTCPPDAQSGQVHITPAGLNAVYVNFASSNLSVASRVSYGTTPALGSLAFGSQQTMSQLLFFASDLVDPVIGPATLTLQELADLQGVPVGSVKQNVWAYYAMPQSFYNSPALHTVLLPTLQPGVPYYYQVDGCDTVFAFSLPLPSVYPLVFGLTADLDFTVASQVNLQALLSMKPHAIIIAGDLSYADGYGWRWDSFGTFLEPLAAALPVLVVGGNHEVRDELWVDMKARWPMPFNASGSTDHTYYSHNVGPAHVIGLNSYAATGPGSAQYTWLQQDLSRVDRSQTPWLIVTFHVPWYSTNTHHYGEAAQMMADMEPILVTAGVDVAVSGHVHSYERSLPVSNGTYDPCGIVHLVVGDGGSREGLSKLWNSPAPNYSAFRQASFGATQLVIYNATHALVTRNRTGCEVSSNGSAVILNPDCVDPVDNTEFLSAVDEAWIVRDTAACSNKLYTGQAVQLNNDQSPSPAGPSEYASPSPSSSSIGSSNYVTRDWTPWFIATIALGVSCGILLVIVIVQAGLLKGLPKGYAKGPTSPSAPVFSNALAQLPPRARSLAPSDRDHHAARLSQTALHTKESAIADSV